MPDAFIFDLDDTITAFDSVCEEAWEEACRVFSLETPVFGEKALLYAICKVRKWYWGNKDRHLEGRMDLRGSRRKIVEISMHYLVKLPDGNLCQQSPNKILSEYLYDVNIENNSSFFETWLCNESIGEKVQPDAVVQEYAFRLADTYTQIQDSMLHILPGALETLKKIKSAGIPMVLITNGNAAGQRKKVVRFGLEPFFKAVLIEGEQGFGKPDPRIYQLALDILGTAPEKTWMVGDNIMWDVAGPKKQGIYSIWVDCQDKGLEPSPPAIPDMIIGKISDLLEYI